MKIIMDVLIYVEYATNDVSLKFKIENLQRFSGQKVWLLR